MDVDIYRIDDKQDRLALAGYGGRTYNPYQDVAGNTIYASDHYSDASSDYVYFDREQQTFGINFQWYAGNFGLQFNAIQNFGKKAYHYGGGDSNVVAGADRQTIGRLYRLEWEQLKKHLGKGYRFLHNLQELVCCLLFVVYTVNIYIQSGSFSFFFFVINPIIFYCFFAFIDGIKKL